MNNKDFIKQFIEWRQQNNYPKRQECRDIFKMFRDADKSLREDGIDDICGLIGNSNGGIERPFWINYVLKQEKPAMFLDGLFKKGSDVTKADISNAELTKKNDEEIENKIIDVFYNYVKETKEIPDFRDLNLDFKVNKYFKTIKELFNACSKKYDLSEYILNESSFDDKYNEYVVSEVKKYDRFIITSAVVNKKVNKLFINSIKTYCDYNNALCLVMPCQDVHNRKTEFKYNLDSELRDFPIVYKDIYLNDNIFLSNIKISAKQILPTTGIPQFTTDGSCIVASPKQDMMPIPNSPSKTPNVIMATGACTYPNYDNDLYMSDRLNKIAEFDHVCGAIIVEIEDNKIFHFRQIQMGSEGEFIDLGIRYSPDGTVDNLTGAYMVLGDSHFGEHDINVLKQSKQMINSLNVNTLVLHDIFTASSITHHDVKKTLTKAIKAEEEKISLKEEAIECSDKLIELLNLVNENIYIVYSNHHCHLSRYLEEGRYAKDPTNLYYSLDLVKAFIDGYDPFEYMMRQKTDLYNIDQEDANRLKFLSKLENKKLYGIEISMHGDKGGNGARGSLYAYKKAFKKSISAHTHVPMINKGAWSVGTGSILDPNYVSGLSSWMHTNCIVYPNGTRQLLNIIRNKDGQYSWRLK